MRADQALNEFADFAGADGLMKTFKEGESVVITERGTPIGRIVPITAPLEGRIEAMAQAGLALWNKKKLQTMPAVAKVHGKRTVADLLIEDRQ